MTHQRSQCTASPECLLCLPTVIVLIIGRDRASTSRIIPWSFSLPHVTRPYGNLLTPIPETQWANARHAKTVCNPHRTLAEKCIPSLGRKRQRTVWRGLDCPTLAKQSCSHSLCLVNFIWLNTKKKKRLQYRRCLNTFQDTNVSSDKALITSYR